VNWTTLGGLWRRLKAADLSINAAAVAFHTFLAMVPLGVALLAVGALVGDDAAAVARISRALDPIAPDAVTRFITELLVDSSARVRGEVWLLVVSVVVALALGSRAIVALQRALAKAENRIEVRGAFQLRLVSLGLTVAGGMSLIVTGSLLVAGRSLFEFLSHLSGFGGMLDLWVWLRIPVATVGLMAFLLACYRFGPPKPVPRAGLAALVGTVGVVLGSALFGVYLGRAAALGATFGSLGAVAAALIWLYLGAVAILAGAVVAIATAAPVEPEG
jgi:membrane protein